MALKQLLQFAFRQFILNSMTTTVPLVMDHTRYALMSWHNKTNPKLKPLYAEEAFKRDETLHSGENQRNTIHFTRQNRLNMDWFHSRLFNDRQSPSHANLNNKSGLSPVMIVSAYLTNVEPQVCGHLVDISG
ncbi:MAG: hypothetical protein CSA81_02650 [Acidobacteria bacterium]|nr:MAG: hypothetical protein CSA81_02650 [Acidobacteriota bacterium]